MKTILKIFKNDLIGIKKSILTIVLAVGLCILPALYAWFNIFANWDPYANTGNIISPSSTWTRATQMRTATR